MTERFSRKRRRTVREAPPRVGSGGCNRSSGHSRGLPDGSRVEEWTRGRASGSRALGSALPPGLRILECLNEHRQDARPSSGDREQQRPILHPRSSRQGGSFEPRLEQHLHLSRPEPRDGNFQIREAKRSDTGVIPCVLDVRSERDSESGASERAQVSLQRGPGGTHPVQKQRSPLALDGEPEQAAHVGLSPKRTRLGVDPEQGLREV